MTTREMWRRILNDAVFGDPYRDDYMFARVHLARAILILSICLLGLTGLFGYVVLEMIL